MKQQPMKPEPLLWLSDARGQYIPRDFAGSFADRSKHVSGVDAGQWETLESGPEHEWYWECWNEVLDSAVITDENGTKFTVFQDGDCWLIPEGMVWSDAAGFFEWPSEED